jgi:hypothetical protein
METSDFVKRLIFSLTTGSILFYLVSFHSVGQTKKDSHEVQECRVGLLKIRSGRPVPVRYQHTLTTENVLQLSSLEQDLVSRYIKRSGISLLQEGIDNPFIITSYRMESPARKVLGYKIVIDSINEESDVMTFYLNKKNKILFWYLEGKTPQQKWACQT